MDSQMKKDRKRERKKVTNTELEEVKTTREKETKRVIDTDRNRETQKDR